MIQFLLFLYPWSNRYIVTGSPELYKKLLTDFKDKELPQPKGLANILDRNFGVKGGAATLASKIFFANLEWLQLIGQDNILTLEGGITPIEEVTDQNTSVQKSGKETDASNTTIYLNPSKVQPPTSDSTKEIPIFLKNGREAKIILPIDFTDDDILKVSKVLSGYLP